MRFAMALTLCATALASAAHAAAPSALDEGRALLRAGDLDAAAERLEQAVEAEPANAEAHHLLGAAYGRQAQDASMFGKMRLAGRIKERFEQAVALAPDAVDYRESLLQFYALAPAIAGGGMDKARVQAEEIAKRDALRGDLARATLANLDGHPDQALVHLRSAAARRPDDARLQLRIGLVLQELERWDEAFAHFESMVARDPDQLAVWYQVGRTAVLADARHAAGEAAFKRYLAATPGEQDPPKAAAHWRLGMLYQRMARPADARAQYQAALALDPDHAEAKAALKALR